MFAVEEIRPSSKNDLVKKGLSSLFKNNSLRDLYGLSKTNKSLEKILTPKLKKKSDAVVNRIKQDCQPENPPTYTYCEESNKTLAGNSIRDYTRRISPIPYENKKRGIQKIQPPPPRNPSPAKVKIGPEKRNKGITSPISFRRKQIDPICTIRSENRLRNASPIVRKTKSVDFDCSPPPRKLCFPRLLRRSCGCENKNQNNARDLQNPAERNAKGQQQQLPKYKPSNSKKASVNSAASIKNEEELRKAFMMFDSDGFGCISTKKLRQILTSIGEALSEEEMQDMIQVVDVDGDGFVSCEQFVKILS